MVYKCHSCGKIIWVKKDAHKINIVPNIMAKMNRTTYMFTSRMILCHDCFLKFREQKMKTKEKVIKKILSRKRER